MVAQQLRQPDKNIFARTVDISCQASYIIEMLSNDVCDSLICIKRKLEFDEELERALYHNEIKKDYRRCNRCNIFWPPDYARCPCCKNRNRVPWQIKRERKNKRVYY